MNTILPRLKTLIKNNMIDTGTLSYVKDVEVLHPELALSAISKADLPKVFFVPDSTEEAWAASQRKEAVHGVLAYLMILYVQRESSILGDSGRQGGQAPPRSRACGRLGVDSGAVPCPSGRGA